jgi:sialate O-acetylesterase
MKRIKFIAATLLLLSSISAIAVEQVEKVVGVIAASAQAGSFGSGDNFGFQYYRRDMNIDASGSEFANLVLKMRVYIENYDTQGSVSVIQQAQFSQLELANDQMATNTYLTWNIKNLGLVHGWNDLYLELPTGNKGANFDLTQPLKYFRFCLAHIPMQPEAYSIRFKDIQLVDKSVLVDPPTEEVTEDWNTDYHIADVPYADITGTLAGGQTNGFSIGRSFDDIDASEHNPKQIYLQIFADITEQTPGDIYVLSRVSGQIELTSSGRADQNEYLWGIGSVDWKPGKHNYTLALSNAGQTNGALDLSHINFMRIYAVNVPADFTGRLTVKVDSVKLIDLSTQTKLPTVFGNKMMFQQNKPVNIWGYATEGKNISVDFYKGESLLDTQSALVPESGKWQVSFASQTASYDKYKFTVREGQEIIQTVEDILFGEVWLSSGQSNMALNVAGTIDGADLMAAADNDNIRMYLEPTYPSSGTNGPQPYYPEPDIAGAYWGSGNEGMQVGKVSAVAYSMAVKLQETLGIPVGILNAAVGSSVIEAWIPREEIENDADLVLQMKRKGLYFDEEWWVDAASTMTVLYNQKVAPLEGYTIAGLIWYQGESNSGRPELYAKELDLLKKGYERIFGFTDNEMPLIFSQVCPWVTDLNNPQYLAPLAEAMYDGWAYNPNTTAMLPLYDTDITYVGNGVIHPTNKTPVGKRFATAALNLVYNGEGEYTAPVFEEMTLSGDRIILRFAHTGAGLQTVTGIEDVRGFAICGDDSVFAGARARIISENEVEVWNPRVKNPKQVTYAWATYNVISNLANSAGIPAAPFRSDRNAGYKHYNPQDWTFADGDIWGIDASEFVGFLPAWVKAPVSGSADVSLSYDSTRQSEGAASLKVQYAASAEGIAGAGPVLTHKTTVGQLADFNTLSVDVLNPDDRDKNMELLLKAADGKVYKALFVGYEGDDSEATAVTVGRTWSFRTITFNIKTLKNELGVTVPANYVATVLPSVAALQFTVADPAAGTIYLDNVQFGFSTEQLPLPSALEAAGNPQPDVYLTGDVLNVKSDAGNLIRKVELVDMQGRIIQSKTNINRPEYSFKVLSLPGIFIARIQSEKSVAGRKVRTMN